MNGAALPLLFVVACLTTSLVVVVRMNRREGGAWLLALLLTRLPEGAATVTDMRFTAGLHDICDWFAAVYIAGYVVAEIRWWRTHRHAVAVTWRRARDSIRRHRR